MSKPETAPHVTAVMALLEDGLPSIITPMLGVAPAKEQPPYLVVYPDTGTVDSSRLSWDNDEIRIRMLIHAVGKGPEQCMWTMDKARNILLDATVAVEGRRTYRMTQTLGPQPMTRDLSSQPPVFLQVAEFRISSQGEA